MIVFNNECYVYLYHSGLNKPCYIYLGKLQPYCCVMMQLKVVLAPV